MKKVRQQKDYYCGPGVLKILEEYHYGESNSQKKIAKAAKTTMGGNTEQQLALYLLKNDFKTIITMWDNRFPNRFYGLPKSEMEYELMKWVGNSNNEEVQEEWKDIEEIYKLGGKVWTRSVTPTDIARETRNRNPLIMHLDCNMLYDRPYKEYSDHFVVAFKKQRRLITLNDPHPKDGGINEYSIDRIIFANYKTGNGSAIFVRSR